MKQKWFWITFIFWVFLAGSVICWALISSPLQFQPQTISRYETQVNGATQKTEFWVNAGRLSDLAPIISREWIKDNWKPLGAGLDLSSVLLKSLNSNYDLSDQLQIKAFERKDTYQVLGLWQSSESDETYGMTCQLPLEALNPIEAKNHWGFPIQPPPNTINLFYEQLSSFKIGFIRLPGEKIAVDTFEQNCSENGFKKTLIPSDEKDKKIFLLLKKEIRILAIENKDGSENLVTLISLKN